MLTTGFPLAESVAGRAEHAEHAGASFGTGVLCRSGHPVSSAAPSGHDRRAVRRYSYPRPFTLAVAPGFPVSLVCAS